MNTHPTNSLPTGHDAADDQRLLDLLVDGELSETQRREVLQRFDRQPQGWRDCALAFLEAQSWQREMSGLAREPVPSAPNSASPASSQPASWWNLRSLGTLLAMAASLLVAFGLGIGLNRLGSDRRAPEAVDFAVTNPTSPSALPAFGASNAPGNSSAPNNVTLVLDGANGKPGSRVQVPVIDQRMADPAWLMNRPSAVPSDVLEALQRMGNQVHQQRQLLPFRMDDGRELLVPVDRLDVQPVNARNYQ